MEYSISATAHAPSAPDASAMQCFHCGLPEDDPGRFRVKVDGAWQPVCCAGCEAVASAILGHGMDQYYLHRSVPAEPPPEVLEDFAIFDHPEVQRGFVRAISAGEHQAALMLEGIRCAACVWLNESVVARLPGVRGFGINATTHRAQLRWDPREIELSAILAAIGGIGFRAHPYDVHKHEAAQQAEQKQALWRLFVAGFGMMQVMMYALPAYLADPGSMTTDVEQLMRWASLALTLPVMFYSAGPFFQAAWRDLGLRRAGMDLPVALGIGVAFAASLFATFSGRGDVYFDSISMFVFLLLCGRTLEIRARHNAARSLDYLARAVPDFALRLGAGDAIERVPITALRAGERVLVRAGERVPADGSIESGSSYLDESLLTGESRPVARQAGDRLIGGSTNVGDPLVVRVDRIGADTLLSSIIRLVEQAATERPRLTASADRVTGWFVAAIVILAAVVTALWWLVDPAKALWIGVAILVVACPCALSLATPVALTVATGALARHGLIACRGHTIETLARATDVVLDKTGTLTKGDVRLLRLHTFADQGEAECLRIAAALEQGSIHPIARAITGMAGEALPAVNDVRHVAGQGIEGQLNGRAYRLGRSEFVLGSGQAQPCLGALELPPGSSIAMLGDEKRCLALLVLGDELRADAREFIDGLRRGGKRVHLVSGDRSETVGQVAAALGIEAKASNATPADKLLYVRALQQSGAVVAMIGDGINDAPVLAQADVSIAMGDGAWMTQRHADAVLVSGRLADLGAGFATAASALAVIRENLFWALAYNLTAVPLAAFGLVTPWMAGIGMSASSLLVILNSLRLQRPLGRATPPRQPARLAGAG